MGISAHLEVRLALRAGRKSGAVNGQWRTVAVLAAALEGHGDALCRSTLSETELDRPGRRFGVGRVCWFIARAPELEDRGRHAVRQRLAQWRRRSSGSARHRVR